MADLDALRKSASDLTQAKIDHRQKALDALAEGGTIRAVSEAANVAVGTLLRWREDARGKSDG